jgi:hypothetical protein
MGTAESSASAKRTIVYGPDIRGNGRYRYARNSGLLTTVAAGTATAGHVFAFRFATAAKLALVNRVRARGIMITPFGTEQEMGLEMIVARSYTASHSGGTAATLTGNQLKKRTRYATTKVTDIRIGDTGALTAGTHTLDSGPMAVSTGFSLVDGATVAQPVILDLDFNPLVGSQGPLVLAPNEGFILRNIVLMGATGTMRLGVEVDWSEADSYPD